MDNFITRFSSDEVVHAIGWTILHSIWQGFALALLLALVLLALRGSSPQWRYIAGLLTLFAMVLSTVTTFSLTYKPLEGSGRVETVQHPFTPSASSFATDVGPEVPDAGSLVFIGQAFRDYFGRHLPLVVAVWLLGVFFLSLRTLGELAFIQHVRYNRSRPAAERWQKELHGLAERLGLRRPVALRESLRINTPMVIGVLKPVVLVPVGLLANLPPEQVQSALAHELAHIRRQDYLVNLLQSFAEILFFFNPGVWWISSFIRAEREHCCDDRAVALTGDELTFVRTLATLEEYRERHAGLIVALAGSRGSVLGRIQRILHGEQLAQLPFRIFWSAGVLLLFGVLGVFSVRSSVAAESFPQISGNGQISDLASEPATITRLEAAPSAGISPQGERTAEVPLFQSEEVTPTALAAPRRAGDAARENMAASAIADTIPENERKRRQIEKEYQTALLEVDKQMNVLRQEITAKRQEMNLLQNEGEADLLKVEREAQLLSHQQQLQQKELQIQESELRSQIANLEVETRQLQQEYTSEQVTKEKPDEERMKKLEERMMMLSRQQNELGRKKNRKQNS